MVGYTPAIKEPIQALQSGIMSWTDILLKG